ncbi:hypothetical protein DAPPUDRAFT_110094 [Daphnia pulex]|uniref:C-type lectin domain-containing protein n=1 Tax=Daphnia pulex TaxID=6669 RepID=E9H572_DAPPU|nr:hypothetical protein DAPPUDRAFT_110094 [Daphnia pulex]|eukprot:EFX73079.1 hypothetical protein DAPPUDRAFT_110094 [Daphnia pulex]
MNMSTHEDEARAKARAEMKILANDEKNTKKIFLYNCLKWKTYEINEFHIPEEGELCLEPRRLFQHLCSGLISPQSYVTKRKTYRIPLGSNGFIAPEFAQKYLRCHHDLDVFTVKDGKDLVFVSAERQKRGLVVQVSNNELFVTDNLCGIPRIDKRYWRAAEEQKENIDFGDLLRIITKEERRYIYALLDFERQMLLLFYSKGEPSHSQTGSFPYINFNFNNTGLWFDEIGPTPTTTDATTASTTSVTTKATTETTKSTTTSTNYQPTALDWAGADSFCRGGNMALIKIESSQENDLIYNHYLATPGITKDIYWTSGRYSRDGNKEWEWATTPPYAKFNYTNWSPNSTSGPQPDFCLNGSDCNPAYAEQFSVDISFFFDGRWYDVVNTQAMNFICESIA